MMTPEEKAQLYRDLDEETLLAAGAVRTIHQADLVIMPAGGFALCYLLMVEDSNAVQRVIAILAIAACLLWIIGFRETVDNIVGRYKKARHQQRLHGEKP